MKHILLLARSFRVRLLTLILLVVIPGVGVSIYGNFEQRRTEKNRIREGAQAIADLAAANQQDFIENARQLLATLTEFPWLTLSTNEPFCRGNFSNLRKILPNYATFGLIETDGTVFCSATTTNTPNLSDRSYFQEVLRTKKFAVSDFQVGRVSGQPTINFGYPVFDEHRELRRVLFASIAVPHFYDAIKDIHLPAKGTLTVLDRSGHVVVQYPDRGETVGKSLLEQPAVRQILVGNRGTFEMAGADGIGRLYAVSPVLESREPRLFVSVEVPLKVLFAPANRLLIRNLVVLAALALLLYLGALAYARYFFVDPVNVLAQAAHKLAAGDLSARAGTVRGPLELGQLGRALDNMAASVQQRTEELLRANQALRTEMAEHERAEQEIRRQEEEKKKLEEQFLRSQRMQSLGALAGGIAHDLNNALVPVLMGSEMLRESAAGKPEQSQLLDLITASGQRCTAMVKQILTFAKGTGSQTGAVPLRHLVLEMAKIAKDTFPKAVKIEYSAPNDLWIVEGEATQLHQILLNLCVNARDAMPDGGTLSLSASNVFLNSAQIPSGSDICPGPFVLLTVRDTGTGIPPDIQQRIFEPFFTTKASDKGTGLGLSTVASLVKRHKGFIQLQSHVGKGTEFKIFLPAAPEQKVETARESASLPVGNGEVILLVDDEQMVLELTRHTLENYRYRILTASNGLEAIAAFEKHQHEIDLIITDRDMPFMDGISAARQIKTLSPDLPIIIASATAPETLPRSQNAPTNFVYLSKPFDSGQLLTAIARALGSLNPANDSQPRTVVVAQPKTGAASGSNIVAGPV
jgi:signal transduction histidine kinase/CheY-like chemotaxis protein